MKLYTNDLLDLAEILETMGADEDTLIDMFFPAMPVDTEKKIKPEELQNLKSRNQYKAMIKVFKQLSKSREKVNELLSKITGRPKDKIDIIEIYNEIKTAGGLANFLSQAQQSQKED